MSAGRRPGIVVWWEELPIGVQIIFTLPLAVGLFWALHRYGFNLPTGRSFTYAGFWGLVATFVIVGSTRAERAKRRHFATKDATGADRRDGDSG
ncbi:MAG: hypothetical protein KDC36_00840 [Thermoleophilia bacterium]|nr:hypothetical protein [Thermoleophilia bacterium]